MRTNLLKRILSFVLALVLLVGNVPATAFAAEEAAEEIVEETVVETTAPTEAATEPTEETTAPTEAATEPAEETAAPTATATEAPTQPETVPAETAAPTEAVTEPAEMLVWQQIEMDASDVELPSNEELHTAYVERAFYGGYEFFGVAAGSRLTGDAKVLYDALVPVIKKIAGGQRASTTISVGTMVTDQYGQTYIPSVEATFTEPTLTAKTVNSAMEALLSDLPYEMYWFDKTVGGPISYLAGEKLMYVEIYLPVTANYRGTAEYTVDTAKTGAAAAAVANAQEIVAEYASASDYEKLVGYRDEICALVDYNHAAAESGNFSENNDPWQLVHAFDGDPNTNIVCEGYAKAFMYLCDETDFAGDVTCYTVTGFMGGGGHMWNIVTLEGENYLVDVTNSDSGSIGQNGGLFLVGGSGSPEDGYTFLNIPFIYDDYILAQWGTGADSILNLAEEDYTPEPTIEIIASGTCGPNQQWTLDENGLLTISGTGTMSPYMSGRNTPWGFNYTGSITSLVIEEGITGVSAYAFEGLWNLKSVQLPVSLQTISSYMFKGAGIESIELPEGVETISSYAFQSCSSLKNIKLPSTLTTISRYAFNSCRALENIVFPEKLTTIGSGAFSQSGLKSVTFTTGLRSVDGAAFGGCGNLKDVYITDPSAWCKIFFGNDDGNPLGSDTTAHFLDENGKEITEIVLDDTVTEIPLEAFRNSNVTSVTMPETVTAIKSKAFDECEDLKYINLPDSLTSVGYWAFGYCAGLESLELPDGLEMIDDYAFCGCSGVKSLTIPGTAKNIGENAFSSWTGLKELVISDGVETIGRMAFSESYLQTLVLPDSVVTLGDAALRRAVDVYYGGTQEQWSQLGSEVPECNFIHYSCTNPVNHWKFVSAEVTCETDGYTCDACDCGYQRNMVITAKAPGHQLSQWITTDEPTCSTDGFRYRECDRCDYVENEVLPGGHVEIIDDAVPATCTETGLTEGKHCGRCGNVLVAQTVEKELGHNMGGWFVSDPATCTKSGTRTKACSRCDYAEHETIPPSHQWSNDTCTACGAVRGTGADGLDWILSGGVMTISGSGDMKNYSYIASSYFTPWKSYSDSIEYVVIERGVTSVGEAAFYGCKNLISVSLPVGLTAIGSDAFSGCNQMSDINLPDSLTTIGTEAFWDCDALTALAIGPNVSKLEASFAGGCQNLTNLTIAEENPYYCTDEKGVIYNVSKTTLVCAPINISGAYVIPDTVTAILTDAFYQCEELTKVKMPANIKRIEPYTFQGCKGLTDVRLPENLETIGIGAFSSASALTSVTIPKWVTHLDINAFFYCTSLKTITFVGNAPKIEQHSFFNVKATAYYHYANTSWTQDKLVGYGGNLIWQAKCTDHMPLPVLGTPATCTRSGLTDGKMCSVCREVYEEQEIIPALGHEPGPWYVYRNPTCTAAGEQRRTCIRCDYFESETIPAAHNFVGGVCTGCGAGYGSCGNGVTWTYADGKLTISGTGAMEDYAGNTAAPWYGFRGAITSVVIEDGITAIGDTAFFQCNNLTNVTIGKDVTVIGRAAFSQCSGLANIVLPDGLITIEDTVFYGCALTSIDIPDSVTAIGDSAFSTCGKLTSVEIPASVTEIGPYAFSRCGNLTEIRVHANNRAYCNDASGVLYTKDMTVVVQAPGALVGDYVIADSVTSLLEGAFSGCQKLTSVKIPDGVKKIPWACFGFCGSLTSIEIPSSVTVIDYAAFQGCGFTKLVIPASVTTIGDYAFCMCNSLESIRFEGDAPAFESDTFAQTTTTAYYPGGNATWTADKLRSYGGNVTWVEMPGGTCGDNANWLLTPDGTLTISGTGEMEEYQAAEAPWNAYKSSIKSVVINKGITVIDNYAFYECSSLTSVVIPDGVTRIDWGVFAECSSLTSIVIPDTVTKIGGYAFKNCSSLKNVVIGNSVTVFSDHAFAGCSSLTGIKIPDSVTWIGFCAFAGCSSLTNIEIPDSVTYIGAAAFENCSSLTSIVIPDSVTEMEGSAFENCSSLASVTIGNGVTSIGTYAFAECSSLTSVTIGNGLTGIDSYMFSGCRSLTSIEIPDSVTWIGFCAFAGCSSLTSVTIPDSVTDIGNIAFGSCSSLTSVTIPDGVTSIGHHAFEYCSSLTSMLIPDSVAAIGAYAFFGCDSLADIYFGGAADAWTALNAGAPKYTRIHHLCTNPDNHWFETEVERTCTTDRYTCEACVCGHERNIVVTMPTAGHAVRTDAAVAPTCTESGLTEGSHCAVCGEILVAQDVIPATGHSYAANKDGIACRTCGVAVSIRISEEYLLLKQGETVKLAVEATSDDLLEAIHWDVEGEEGILSVEQDGTVTAQGVGTAYVVAELTYDDFTLSARCRVDVSENMQIGGISLSTQKVTAELYSTNYAGFEVLLQLPQNYSLMAEGIDVEAEHKGIAIEKAVFADASTAEMFDILVLDDRSVQIIPKDDAVNNPKLVKGTYKSAVTVTVLGQEHTSEVLTLTVKKTLPKLTASVAAFNSFYSGQSNQIIIKNATPTNFVVTSIPTWLELTDETSGILTLKKDAPLKSASGKLSVQVETEQWRIPATVNLTVKNTYKARGLKLSATSVTAAANSAGISLKLLCTGKKDTLAGLNVKDITAPAGYSIESFSLADGSFILKADKGFVKGTVKLEVTFRDTTVKQALNLNVTPGNITLTPSAKTVTLNKTYGDSTTITFTANPKDYKLEDLEIRLTTSKGADKLNSGELEITENGNRIVLKITQKTPDKGTYKLYVKAGGSKEVAVTVNVVTAEPTVTFKATGNMDLSFPEQAAIVTPTFKNCGGEYTFFSYTVEELKGKTVVDDAVKNKFEVQRDGRTLKIRCVDEDITLSNSYRFKFKLTLENGQTVSNTVTLKVKRTAVKLKLSATKLTLNKWANDKAEVTVSCTTKNYILGTPSVTVKDSTNQEASTKLDISYAGGKLTVATNDATVYGMTYKITLKANDYAPASVLTVSIPAKEKSDITATIKVSGKIDVIRGSSAVTVTPTYKNRALAEPKETIVIYNAAGEDVSHLFTAKANGKGGYSITKAKNAELPTGTYKIKLTATFGSAKTETKLMNMTVTMGSAKLTVKTDDVFLFANDKNDRVRVWFERTDKALNDVAKIEIKDAKYQDIFEVYDYENGTFGIGFKGDVPKNLAGTTVTLNLNVYLTGNTSAKPNATVKVKLTIMK